MTLNTSTNNSNNHNHAQSAVPIAQTSHGFSVGNVLYLVGTVYTLAMADDVVSGEAIGIVSSVTDANNFVLTTSGLVTGLSGLTAGETYFLSPTVAGALTNTRPSSSGQVVKPLLVADSTTSGYFINFLGQLIGPAAGSSSTVFASVEKDLGQAKMSGSFQITGLSGLSVGKPVLINQAAGPYTGKGTLADEAEMDHVSVSGIVTSTSVITAYWNSPTFVSGNFKFNYLIGA